MSAVILLNDDELDRALQARFLERRGLSVAEAPESSPVIIADLTCGTPPPEGGSDRLLLLIEAGEKERFRLRRVVGSNSKILGESDAKMVLLDICCDEVEKADETLSELSGSGLGRLLSKIIKLPVGR